MNNLKNHNCYTLSRNSNRCDVCGARLPRLIDADKLPITNTYALIDSKDVKPNEIPFAPLVCVLKSDIDNAPTVEERPKGKWIKRGYIGCDTQFYWCSVCEYERSYDAETGLDDYNFCPNCGTDMRGDETSNKGKCIECPYKTDTCQEGLHCPRD